MVDGLLTVLFVMGMLLLVLVTAVLARLMLIEQKLHLVRWYLGTLTELAVADEKRRRDRLSLPEAKSAGDALDEWEGWDWLNDPDGWKNRPA